MSQIELDQLQDVNTRINAIPYVGLVGPTEPVDQWLDTPLVGESWVCRDYVLAKAKALGDMGWDGEKMSVVLCWTEVVALPPNDREYHAVLGVKVDTGVLMILDSRFDTIYPWDSPPAQYIWDRQQVAMSAEFRDARGGLV